MTTKRAALYVRVSTDRQTVANQVEELTAIAARRGWEIVETYRDEGISGTKGRDQRPGLDRMLSDASRRRFDVVMTWALDRLGRSLIDVVSSVEHMRECGIDLYVEKFSGDQTVDTTSPAGRLMFVIFAGVAEFERGLMRQRVAAGIKRARAAGVQFGRPKIDGALERAIRRDLEAGKIGMLKIAAKHNVGSSTVQRIKADMER